MLTDLPGLFLWGVPGLLVWLVGFVFVGRAAFTRHERSPRGLRLWIVGNGLFMLGLTVGLSIAAVVHGVWPVAIVVVVGGGLPSLVFFRLAGRVGVSTGDSAREEMDHRRKES